MPFWGLVVCAVALGPGHVCLVIHSSQSTWDQKRKIPLCLFFNKNSNECVHACTSACHYTHVQVRRQLSAAILSCHCGFEIQLTSLGSCWKCTFLCLTPFVSFETGSYVSQDVLELTKLAQTLWQFSYSSLPNAGIPGMCCSFCLFVS